MLVALMRHAVTISETRMWNITSSETVTFFDKVKALLMSIVTKWCFLESVSEYCRYSIAIFQMSPYSLRRIDDELMS